MWIRRRRTIAGAALLAIAALLILNRHFSHSAASAPSWNGITPGVTTRAEVRELLGEPDTKWLGCDYPNFVIDEERHLVGCLLKFWVLHYGYYHEEIPDYTNVFHQIQFDRHNTVEYLVEIRWPNADYDAMTVDDLVATYGRPERVVYSLTGSSTRAILYCEQGLILHADYIGKSTMGVAEKLYFAPMSTEECIKRFFNQVSVENPDPNGHVQGSLDPWGFNDSPTQEE